MSHQLFSQLSDPLSVAINLLSFGTIALLYIALIARSFRPATSPAPMPACTLAGPPIDPALAPAVVEYEQATHDLYQERHPMEVLNDLDGDEFQAILDEAIAEPLVAPIGSPLVAAPIRKAKAAPKTMAAPAKLTVAKVLATHPKHPAQSSASLRKLCTARGIKWRNAHGKDLHLTQTEMIAKLQELS